MHAILMGGAGEWVTLRSPYNEDFIKALKDAIPSRSREWDRVHKGWRIALEWADVVVDLVEEHGGTVIDKRPPPSTAVSVPKALGEACVLLHVAPDAPLEVGLAAYKAMARKCPPDVGGDTQTMQALNEAIAVFKTYAEAHA